MKGLIVLSKDLDGMANELYNNQVPSLWLKRSYPSLKPYASYLDDFVEKMAFFQGWIDNGQPNVFWISGIFFTHALLTGTLQNYARKNNLPIDLVVFDYEIMPSDDENTFSSQPDFGMYTRGCFLEGCVWNYETMELDESKPKVGIPTFDSSSSIVGCRRVNLTYIPSASICCNARLPNSLTGFTWPSPRCFMACAPSCGSSPVTRMSSRPTSTTRPVGSDGCQMGVGWVSDGCQDQLTTYQHYKAVVT